MAVPRLIRNAVTRQIIKNGSSASGGSSSSSSSRSNTISRYSPQYILSQLLSSKQLLTVKRSLKRHGRFFMYEESHDVTPNIITVTPDELTALLQQQQQQPTNNRDHDTRTTTATTTAADYHYYWTAPIKSVAPASLLENEFQWYKQLYNNDEIDDLLLDPRGPSLWMGTSGSGTQCHYDVANNIIVQLYGTKRIRCYPPSMGIFNLHVFPDAHPKARKSQIDFDIIDNDDYDKHIKKRFPHYYYNENTPKPTLDVILQPGDALEIPAFTFHHVENGHIPNAKKEEDDDENDGRHYDDLPSVSLNSFALSKPMMIAQGIFQKASRPMGRNVTEEQLNAPSILRELGISLIQQLHIDNTAGKEVEFIRKYLLKARYFPLMDGTDGNTQRTTARRKTNKEVQTQKILTSEQVQTINSCIERIMPDFHLLIDKEDHGEGSSSHNNDGKGILLLVAFHLMELWAVELVGAQSVASAWDDALS